MNKNEIFKYMKTLARMHPRHRSRYSHTAYLHSTIPDPVQDRMIDRYVAKFYNREELKSQLLLWCGNPRCHFRVTLNRSLFNWFFDVSHCYSGRILTIYSLWAKENFLFHVYNHFIIFTIVFFQLARIIFFNIRLIWFVKYIELRS